MNITGKSNDSALGLETTNGLLIKILSELRVQSLLMAEAFGIQDDIGALRNEVMSQGAATTTDV